MNVRRNGRHDASTLYSNESFVFAAYIAIILTLVIVGLSLAGFVALYLVKSRRLQVWFPNYYETWRGRAALSVLVTVLIVAGSLTTFVLVERPVPEYLPDFLKGRTFAELRLDALSVGAAKFLVVLWVGITAGALLRRVNLNSSTSPFGRVLGTLALAAAFCLYPLIDRLVQGVIVFYDIPRQSYFYAQGSTLLILRMAKQVVYGTYEHWYYPFQYLYGLAVIHRGNQFSMAQYYPGVLIIIGSGGVVGLILRSLGLPVGGRSHDT